MAAHGAIESERPGSSVRKRDTVAVDAALAAAHGAIESERPGSSVRKRDTIAVDAALAAAHGVIDVVHRKTMDTPKLLIENHGYVEITDDDVHVASDRKGRRYVKHLHYGEETKSTILWSRFILFPSTHHHRAIVTLCISVLK